MVDLVVVKLAVKLNKNQFLSSQVRMMIEEGLVYLRANRWNFEPPLAIPSFLRTYAL